MYIFRGRGVFINVYKADDKIATSGAMSLADINLRRTYRAIDSVSTGRIPSLFCAITIKSFQQCILKANSKAVVYPRWRQFQNMNKNY